MVINKCFYCMQDMPSDTAVCPHCGKRIGGTPQPEFALQPGTILNGRYLMGAVLGQGGFGLTYIGYDLRLGIRTAIKEYYPAHLTARSRSGSVLWGGRESLKERGCENFLKEARKMARLRNVPQIVGVQDIILENNTAYIVMDFVEGITLKEKLIKDGLMSAEQILSLLGPVAGALDRAHGCGIIHRDISPDNIMIDTDGLAMLLDLGAAKEIEMHTGGDMQSSQLIHKDGFSPLEQYTSGSSIGPWTDVYALSATVYYCLTGKLVPSALQRLGDKKAVPFPAWFPENIRNALEKGLALHAKDRYQTVGALWSALEKPKPEPKRKDKEKHRQKTKHEPKAERAHKTESESKKKPKKKARKVVALIVCVLCLLAAGLIFFGIRFLDYNGFLPSILPEPTAVSAHEQTNASESFDADNGL